MTYIDRVSEVSTNYNKAIKKLQTLLEKINRVDSLLSPSYGDDIDQMKADVKKYLRYYSNIKQSAESWLSRINGNAELFDTWYNNKKNLIGTKYNPNTVVPIAIFPGLDYSYIKIDDVTIEGDGLTYIKGTKYKNSKVYVVDNPLYLNSSNVEKEFRLSKKPAEGIEYREEIVEENLGPITGLISEMKTFKGGVFNGIVDDEIKPPTTILPTTVSIFDELVDNTLFSKEELEYAVDKGYITEDEAKEIIKYINDVDKVSKEEGNFVKRVEKIKNVFSDSEASKCLYKVGSIVENEIFLYRMMGFNDEQIKIMMKSDSLDPTVYRKEVFKDMDYSNVPAGTYEYHGNNESLSNASQDETEMSFVDMMNKNGITGNISKTPTEQTIDNLGYHSGNMNANNLNYDYNIYIPQKASTGEKLPLVVYLHGGNQKVNSAGLPKYINEGKEYSCMVFAPQKSDKISSWSEAVSNGDLETMINDISTKYNVDKESIYMMGFSDGASAVYKYVANHPGKISAFTAFDGAPSRNDLSNINSVPGLCYTSTTDDTVKNGVVYELIKSSKANNDVNHLVEVSDNHNQVMNERRIDNAIEWMQENGKKG